MSRFFTSKTVTAYAPVSELEEEDSLEEELSLLEEELSLLEELLAEEEELSLLELDARSTSVTKCDTVLVLFRGVTGAASSGSPSMRYTKRSTCSS